MTAARWFVLKVLLLALMLPSPSRAQTEATFDIGHYAFENGGELPSMKVGYVTWGKLDDAKDNAILLATGTPTA